MAAIVSGNGLGLFNSSLNLLGGLGPQGQAGLGRSNERVYVNSATGNLVIQNQDDVLIGTGIDLALIRTYNSQGLLNDDNGDNWRLNVHRKLVLPVTGTLNTAGSTVKRVNEDGSESVYTYDATLAAYQSTDGDGAHDTLSFNANIWTWTDGSRRNTETYNTSGQLTATRDVDGNTTTYSYTGALLTQITDTSGQVTTFGYTGTDLTQITTLSQGVTQTKVRYFYDGLHRLSQVVIDLTPENAITLQDGNSDGLYETVNGQTYVTTYTYDADSNRVASITQGDGTASNDGTTISFLYDTQGRVRQYTDGEGKITILSYTQTTQSTPGGSISAVVTLPTSETYNLNTSAADYTVAGWGANGSPIDTAAAAATKPQVTFDQNGNGLSVWAQGTDLYYSTYTKSTDTWVTTTSPSLDGTLTGSPTNPHLSMSANGNALVTWIQNNNVYARRRISGTWDGATTIPNLENLAGTALNPVGAINDNGRAVVVFLQPASGTTNNLYANVYNGTDWQTNATAVDDLGAAANGNSILSASVPSVAIDAQNNATVLWLQKINGTDTWESLFFSRYNGTAWSAPVNNILENTNTTVTAPKIAFDGNGDGFVIWVQGTSLKVARYTKTNDTWTVLPDLTTTTPTVPHLSMSANGNALVTWIQGGNVFASRYTAGAWVAAVAVENLSGAVATPVGAINDSGQAAVAYVQTSGTPAVANLHVTRFVSGAWQTTPAQTPIETNANAASVPSVAIDAQGNVATVWLQDATANVYTNRYRIDAYYRISATSWSTIANTLYGNGSQATADKLSTSWSPTPTLTAGNLLLNPPASLVVTVPSYYVVTAANMSASDPWASVTQSIYNTTNADVINALKAHSGTPTLTAGLHLPAPATLPYNVTTITGTQTDVVDALGFKATYVTDTQGRLTKAQTPGVNGSTTANGTRLETTYTYDADGNVKEIKDARGNITAMDYDTRGNVIVIRDSEGNTTTRTYSPLSATHPNQLLTETVYTGIDPDGSGPQTPSGALTTRYVYDVENHLRFSISPEGRVMEHQYDLSGNRTATLVYSVGNASSVPATPSESDLIAWTSTQDKTKIERTDYVYEPQRSNLSSVTTYSQTDANGVGVSNTAKITRFFYDQRGLLLQTIDARGSANQPNPGNSNLSYASTFTYDGLGRVQTTAQWIETGDIRTTITSYDDLNRRTNVTLENGLLTTSTFDRAGRLLNIAQIDSKKDSDPSNDVVLGTTTYQYDADGRLRITTDPTGIKTFYLYDEAGRQVAVIDGTGAVTETVYDAAGNAIREIGYATRLTAAQLATLTDTQGNPTNVSVTDPQGNKVDRTLASVRPATTSDDRVVRRIYDKGNRLVATVDADGYLTQQLYDGTGQIVKTVRYAQAVNLASLPSDPTPAQVIPAAVNPTTSTATVAVTNQTQTLYADPVQPYTYVGSAKQDTAAPATQSVTLQVIDNTIRQSALIKSYAWVRSGNTLVQTTGMSLDVGAAVRDDNTPTQVRATIYRSNGSLVGTVTTDVGFASTVSWSEPYQTWEIVGYETVAEEVPIYNGEGDITGYRTFFHDEPVYGWVTHYNDYSATYWNAVNNWNGQVNLGSGPLAPDTYTIVIETRDDAVAGRSSGNFHDNTDATWVRTNTVTAVVGNFPRPATVTWPASTQPANTSVSFRYRTAGSGAAYAAAPVTTTGGTHSVTIGNPGSYEYQVEYRDNYDRIIKSASGTLDVSAGSASASFGYTEITSTPTTGSSIRGYINPADVPTIDYVSASVYDQANGALVSSAVTYPEFESNYAGDVNLKTGTPLASGAKYRIDVAIHYKDGRTVAQQFDYEVGPQPYPQRTTTFGWDINQPVDSIVTFSYIAAGASTSTDATVTQVNGKNQVSMLDLTAGNYQYTIRYLDSATQNVVMRATGTFVVGADGVVSGAATFGQITQDRVERTEYDADGRVRFTLDAECYLTEYRYTKAGRLSETIRYATAAAEAHYLTTSLAQLVPGATANDRHTYNFYDAKGQLVAALSADGYLTEYDYDAAGNRTIEKRFYNKSPAYTGQTVADLRPAADANDCTKLTAYNGANEVTSLTERYTNPANGAITSETITDYHYDEIGNLVKSTKALNTPDARTAQARYDVQGRLREELSGEGTAAIDALSQDMPMTAAVNHAALSNTATVAPYYVVNPDDTWTHITQTVYGTGAANAVAALQAALGTTTLTTGAHLTMPAQIDYTATGIINVNPNDAQVATTDTRSYALTNAASTTDTQTTTQTVNLNTAALTPGSSNPSVLQNWIPVQNLTAAQGTWLVYTIDVPVGASELWVSTQGGSGDADLFVRRGAAPLMSAYDASSEQMGNNEGLLIENPAAGTWYIGVYAYDPISGVQLDAHYQSGTGQTIALQPGIAVNGLYGVDEGLRSFSFNIPAGTSDFRIMLSGSQGDADLYLNPGAPVDPASPTYSSAGPESDESITITNPTAGTWYALVRGFWPFYADAKIVFNTNLGANTPPTVEAGAPKRVSIGANVALNATASDAQGAVTYQWTQVGGPAVTLSNATSAGASFTAPNVASPTLLTFRVRATDNQGASNSDTIYILVDAAGADYLIPDDATWSSVATTLYGTSAVATQLQNALGNPPLTPGNRLSNLPANLTYTTTTTVTVAPYYIIPADATWSSIATTLYASANVGDELQTQQGNRALTAGSRLTNLLPSLTDTFTVPAYYVVRSGDTWGTITQTVYGTNDPSAVSALQTETGSPTLTTGLHLTVPRPLSYSGTAVQHPARNLAVLSTTETVPEYYLVRAGDTWTDITQVVYGTSDANAVAALQTELRNPALTTDAHLAVPAELHYVRLAGTVDSAAINAVWNQWSIKHGYDDAGRRASTTDQNGNTTLFYYDGNGRLTHTINAAGEIKETIYNAFGQASDTITYDARLTTSERTGLVGGLVPVALKAILDGRRDASANGHVENRYTVRGAVRDAIIWETATQSQVTHFTYNAFGELAATDQPGGTSARTFTDYQYDRRGLLTRTIEDSAAGGLHRTTSAEYDAFGRVIRSVDAKGNPPTTYVYNDRLGQKIVIDALGHQQITTYDVYSRVLTQTDGRGNVTTYAYNETARSLTIGTSLGITTVSTYNRHGETVSITDGNNATTTYTYDKNGNLKSTVIDSAAGGLNLKTETDYDRANRQVEARDASGTRTTYGYDAANRLLTRVVDPGGLNLTTTYEYDRQGNTFRVTEGANVPAEARITQYSYDRKGQLKSKIIDPDGLHITTVYAYDPLGRTASITEGAGTAEARTTEYQYDNLGRRIQETKDVGAGRLNIVTIYAYDLNDNLIRTTEASGTLEARIRRTVYDAANRPTFAIDAEGYVTQRVYDNNGNVVKELRYANALQGTFTDNVAPQIVTAPPATGSYVILDAVHDRVVRYVYDADGRLRYSVDGEGYVTEHRYDNLGRETQRIRYADVYTVADGATAAGMAGLLPASIPATAVHEETRYDKAGRVFERVNGELIVTRNLYDLAGRLTDVIRAFGTADASTTHYIYDKAGRVTDEIQAYNTAIAATTRYVLDALGNRKQIIDPRGIELAESDTAWALASRSGRSAGSLSVAEKAALRLSYTITQQFDRLGRITRMTDALGNFADTEYDAHGNAIKVTDPLGNSGYFYFNARNQVTLYVDPEGYVLQSFYDNFGNLKKSVHYANRAQRTWSTSQPPVIADGALASGPYVLRDAGDATHPGHDQVTEYDYDKRDLKTKVTDAENNYAQYVYDAFGNALSSRNQLNGITTYTYDRVGNVKTETLPINALNGMPVVNRYEYDARGNRIKQTEASGSTEQRITTFEYDKLDRQRKKIGEPVHVFDINTFAVTGLQTPVEAFNYDARGNRIETIASNGARSLCYYDVRDRKIAEVSAVGALTVWQYANSGTHATTELRYGAAVALPAAAGATPPVPVDAANVRETRFVYDANDRVRETIVPNVLLGEQASGASAYSSFVQEFLVIASVYDAAGNEVETIDARGHSTFHYYDRLGRKILQVDPGKYVTQFELDASANVIREIRYANALSIIPNRNSDVAALIANASANNGDKRVTEFSYDRMSRVSEKRVLAVSYGSLDANGNLVPGTDIARTKFEYNGLGQVTKQTDATGAVSETEYDKVGRTKRELGAQFTDFEGSTVRPVADTEYDGLGQVTRALVRGKDDTSEADDRIASYTYDYGFGARLLTETDPAGGKTFYDYDRAGNVVHQALLRSNTDGTAAALDRTTHVFDLVGREVWRKDVGTGRVDETRYNVYGEITGKRTNGGGLDAPWQEVTEYDKLGRVWKSNTGDGIYRVYIYDANGNATLKIESAGPDFSTLTLDQVMNRDVIPDSQKYFTVSQYDENNRLTDVYQPKMLTSHTQRAIEQFITVQSGAMYTGGTVIVGPVAATPAVTFINPGSPSVTIPGPVAANVTLSFAASGGSVYYTDRDGNQGLVGMYVVVFDPAHSFSLTLPDTSVLGEGDVRIAFNLSAADPALPGYTGSFSVHNGNLSPSFTFTERLANGETGNVSEFLPFIDQSASDRPDTIAGASAIYAVYDRTYSYSLYKQVGTVEVPLGSYTGTTTPYPGGGIGPYANSARFAQTTGSSVTVGAREVEIRGQNTDARRLVFQYRPAGSTTGWSVMSLSPRVANSGWFYFDWSSWARGDYEFRYTTLDVNGTVLNSQAGSMTLRDDASASIHQTSAGNGVGRAFMDSNGQLNVLEQGPYAKTLTVTYRHAGTSEAWQTRTADPSTLGGTAFGCFAFSPAAWGMSGNYEYWIEAKDGNVVVNRARGTFTVGVANSVSALADANTPDIVHFVDQPSSAVSMQLWYRRVGTTEFIPLPSRIEKNLTTGQFDWDASSLVLDRLANYDVEYKYLTYAPGDVVVDKAHGTLRLGASPSRPTDPGVHTSDVIPALVTITPAQTNARKLVFQYRTDGSTGAYTSVTLTRASAAESFVWDADTVVPSGTSASLEYFYDLYDAANAAVLANDGSPVHVEGVVSIGTAATSKAFKWVIIGTSNSEWAIHRQQHSNAFGEVDSEIDGRGVALTTSNDGWSQAERVRLGYAALFQNLTDADKSALRRIYTSNHRYNALGQLIEKQDPETNITLANGFVQRGRPTTRYTYDLAGRLIAIQDPNGNTSTQQLLSGTGLDGDAPLVLAAIDPLHNRKRTAYDVFGDARVLTDENDRATRQEFDKLGQLKKVIRPVRAAHTASNPSDAPISAVDLYDYDEAGNRIRHTNADGKTEKTYYDSLGQVLNTRSFAGYLTTFSYLYDPTIVGAGGKRVGGWLKTTLDAYGKTGQDKEDTFGRRVWHRDLGNREFTYTYNYAGWLVSQVGSGQNIVYDYYANGYVKSVDDIGTGSFTKYEYDLEGNRTYEGYERTIAGGNREFYQGANIEYDELNRVTRIKDPAADIRYEYDANGNRRRVWSYYHDGVDGSPRVQDYWYQYDALNRFVITMGRLSSRPSGNVYDAGRGTSATDALVSIEVGNTGVSIGYDVASQRRVATHGSDGHRENYDYSADGYLEDVSIDGVLRARRRNDILGRVVEYQEYDANRNATFGRASSYDADNRLREESQYTSGSQYDPNAVVTQVLFSNTLARTTSYDYFDLNDANNDNAGPLKQSSTHEQSSNVTSNLFYTYEWWDSAKEKTVTTTPYHPDLPDWKSGYSNFFYDVNGHLVQVNDVVGQRAIKYTNDSHGQVLVRDEIDGARFEQGRVLSGNAHKLHRFYYLDGHRVGDVGNDGPLQLSYAEELARDRNRSRDEMNRDWTPIASADFDQNYEPVNMSSPGATAWQYRVRSGDTLQSIAALVWGDASMWYLIADANGLAGSGALVVDEMLTIPNKVTNVHNNTGTFQVYNPGEAIGDTLPTTPLPVIPTPTRKKKYQWGRLLRISFKNTLGVPPTPNSTKETINAFKDMFKEYSLREHVRKWVKMQTAPSPRNVEQSVHANPGMPAVEELILNHPLLYMIGQYVAGYFTFGYGAAAWAAYFNSIQTGSSSKGARAGALALIARQVSNAVDAGAAESGAEASAAAEGGAGAGVGIDRPAIAQFGAIASPPPTVAGALAGNIASQTVAMTFGWQKKFDWRALGSTALGAAMGPNPAVTIAQQFIMGRDEVDWESVAFDAYFMRSQRDNYDNEREEDANPWPGVQAYEQLRAEARGHIFAQDLASDLFPRQTLTLFDTQQNQFAAFGGPGLPDPTPDPEAVPQADAGGDGTGPEYWMFAGRGDVRTDAGDERADARRAMAAWHRRAATIEDPRVRQAEARADALRNIGFLLGGFYQRADALVDAERSNLEAQIHGSGLKSYDYVGGVAEGVQGAFEIRHGKMPNPFLGASLVVDTLAAGYYVVQGEYRSAAVTGAKWAGGTLARVVVTGGALLLLESQPLGWAATAGIAIAGTAADLGTRQLVGDFADEIFPDERLTMFDAQGKRDRWVNFYIKEAVRLAEENGNLRFNGPGGVEKVITLDDLHYYAANPKNEYADVFFRHLNTRHLESL